MSRIGRTSWTRQAAIVLGMALFLAAAQDAEANCQNGSTAQTVTGGNGTTLYNVLLTSTAPCTITVGPGTYQAPTGLFLQFNIPSGITVISSAGPTQTILRSDWFNAVAIWPINNSCPSGARLEGFTVEGQGGGVFVGAGTDISHPGCASNQVTGVTLRQLIVSPTVVPAGGHGIEFHGVQNSVIDSVWVARAFANGIFLNGGSNGNIVMNSSVTGSMSQMAIAIQDGNDNVIVGNTIAVSDPTFDAIFVNSTVPISSPGSSRNRIERNNIQGHKIDAVVINTSSHFNYVGLNFAVSNSFHPINKPVPNPISGVGIWVNNNSNGNYLFGNDLSGSPENGIDVFRSKSTYVQGNTVHANREGGIFVANVIQDADPSSPAPQDTVVHGNAAFFNTFNGQLNFEGALRSDVAYNFLSGAQTGVMAGTTTAGFVLHDSDSATFYENTVSEIGSRAFIHGATTNTLFFRNRFVKGTNDPNRTDGRNGVTYALAPSSVTWDAGLNLGGNHWSDFFAAAANPDPTHPYNAFIGNVGGLPNVDRLPYQSETLSQPLYLANSVTMYEPVAGSVLAAGTRKTVRWVGRGCSYVDLYLGVGGSLSPLASGVPNTGFYILTVPAVAPGSYFIQAACLNSDGLPLGVSGQTGTFTIASSSLKLMTPGRGFRATNNGTVRVGWATDGSVPSVNIFVKSGSGSETQVATAVTGTIRDITLPAGVSNSSLVTIRIANAAGGSAQDSVDGYFMVRGTPTFTTNLSGQTLSIGEVRPLEWVGRFDSFTLDLDLYSNSGATFVRSIVKNLPDFGNFTWLVPDATFANTLVRATFKNASGGIVGTADSAMFTISRSATPPPPTNGAPARRDFDGDGKSDLTVFRPIIGMWYTRYSSQGYDVNGFTQTQWGLPGDIPLSADFDGDGKIELTVFRPPTGEWFIRYSSQGYNLATYGYYQWGLSGDIPVAADFDGDGKTELTVFRPSNGTWYTRYSTQGFNASGFTQTQWGLPGDVPLSGDFDGDGKTELTVYRPASGEWFIRYSSLGYNIANYAYFQWGLFGDLPLITDFDGDGKADLAVYRPTEGGWYVRYSSQAYNIGGYSFFQWGAPGDQSMTVDFDGDGKTDLAVFRPATGEWFIRHSSQNYNNVTGFQWGLAGDLLLK